MFKTHLKLHLLALIVCACTQLVGDSPSITLEHAWTPAQINWGLMQRKILPTNHGMLFHYDKAQPLTFWSFNCYLDLSVAFIDAHRIIRDIQPLYAHPDRMDPKRPVRQPEDLKSYGPNDPIVRYFLSQAAVCSIPVKYVLEMNLGWFENNQISVGDEIQWDLTTHTAFFRKKL